MGALLESIANFLWGIPLLTLLIGGSLVLLYHSRFIPLLGFKHALSLVFSSKSQGLKKDEVSHFEALCNALAATIGLGNIAGVAVALNQGGPGAIFWMWIAALLGMNTKFFECTLAVLYRGKNYKGDTDGGPMYYIEKGLGKKYKFVAIFFAICGVIGTLSLFQINQLATFLDTNYELDRYITGLVFSIVIFYVLKGGLRRITALTSKVVPMMSGLYVILCLIILSMNLEAIPEAFSRIFLEAFALKPLTGGAMGYGVAHVIRTGFKRAAFSNEAGVGTAPMAHANVKTSEPISEGYVAMLGPFVDTLIVCTLTAVTILVSVPKLGIDINGIDLTTLAFTNTLGQSGKGLLGIIIFLFSFSTMIGMAFYNQKCWDYLFKGRFIFKDNLFILYYSFSLFIGALIKMNVVVQLIDIAYALMAVPNMIVLVKLAKTVKTKLNEYNEKYL